MAGIDNVVKCLINGGRKYLPKNYNIQKCIDDSLNVERTALIRFAEDIGELSTLMSKRRLDIYEAFTGTNLNKVSQRFYTQDKIDILKYAESKQDFIRKLENVIHGVSDEDIFEYIKVQVKQSPYAKDTDVIKLMKNAERNIERF